MNGDLDNLKNSTNEKTKNISKSATFSAGVDVSRFKPMTEGLGLDHFSDGLPYAPVGDRKKNQQQITSRPVRPSVTQEGPASAYRSSAVGVVPPIVKEQETTTHQNQQYGAPLVRGVAFLFDLILSVVIASAILWTGFYLNGHDFIEKAQNLNSIADIIVFAIFVGSFSLIYFLVQEMVLRTTLGKALFSLRVVNDSSVAVFFKNIFWFFSVAFLGLGLFWSFFDSKRRCLHDILTGTVVQKR